MSVVVLAGGTGGAKLARGFLDLLDDPGQLTVIANTGDDTEIYGAYVSPDPDLITFWLADLIDDRGWGLAGDTFSVMDALRDLGREVWFNLGDRDLAIGLERARRLAEGERLTVAHAALARTLGVQAQVLPMCDEPVRTRILAAERSWSLQEYLIQGRGHLPVQDVSFSGVRAARATPEVLAAIERAEVIVIGPSNPVISLGPILAVPGIREALAACPAPVVAVSPVVAGQVLKGPTADFLNYRRVPISGAGVAELLTGLIDGYVADEPVEGLPVLRSDLLMSGADGRRRLAAETLSFARGLAR